MYAQILIGASLLLAGYQDFRERLVSDLVWIPALIGAALVFILAPSLWLLVVIRLALVGAISFGFTKYGSIGQADAIALVLVSADPSPLTPIPTLFAGGVVALSHIGYLFLRGYVGKPRLIPIAQFRREARWIPKAIVKGGVKTEVEKDVNINRESVEKIADENTSVEVQYGVPTVSYIGAGYLAYLVYLAIFDPSVLLGLA
ncbi:MAG: prepilin peptidase [Thaumarchaeota archaeon]|nr:prepilin peptidase [Nitrososphaerota archaeon]MBI3116064.1 prepilin peptidase [Nitrososphaerota archaeon]